MHIYRFEMELKLENQNCSKNILKIHLYYCYKPPVL